MRTTTAHTSMTDSFKPRHEEDVAQFTSHTAQCVTSLRRSPIRLHQSKRCFVSIMPFVESLECGLIHHLEHLHLGLVPVPVPLTKVHVDVRVVNFIAEVKLTQEYVNRESEPIEATYLFPVEEESAVVEFEALVDDREIKTVVKGKEEARQDYREALANKRTALLLEETKSDVFEIKVGQLKPSSKAKVVIKYISELPVEEEAVRLTVPMTIAPRYTPPSDSSEGAKALAGMKYTLDSPAPLVITTDVWSKNSIKTLKSPSHSVITEDSRKEGEMYATKSTLSGTTSEMNKDFILMIESENIHDPVVYFEKSSKLDAHAAMVSLVPQFKLKEQKVDLIFLVDRSGSMGWGGGKGSIELAKEALLLFLHSLPPDCFFNVYSFGSRFDSLFPLSSRYTDDTLHEAKAHVSSMSANYGGTEIYHPLEAILKQPAPSGYLRQVFVLTDGAVSNDEQVIKLVQRNRERTRLFSLGLGASASRHLVKGIARAGNGTSVFSNEGEDLRPKVMGLLKNSLQPAISNVKVEWKDVKGTIIYDSMEEKETETKKTLLGYMKQKMKTQLSITGPAPSKLPPVYDGQRLLAFCLFSDKENPVGVQVTAESPDGPLTVYLDITDGDFIEGEFVHQLGARKRIQDLEEGSESEAHTGAELKGAIVRLGTKYNLASRHTSFVGVDPKDCSRQYYGVMAKRLVPNQMPQNFGGMAFGGGGGADRHRRALGSCGMAKAMSYKSCGASRSPKKKGKSKGSRGPAAPNMPQMLIMQQMAMASNDVDDDGVDEERMMRSSEMARNKGGNLMTDTEKSTEDSWMELVGLQSANGAFKWGSVLERMLNKGRKDAVVAKGAALGCDNESAWITALALKILEKKFAAEREMWELVASKAMKFLGEEAHVILGAVESFL